jgi:hypothetical protein
MSYNSGPSIVLAELWERQSAKGNQYFTGFMGNVSLALLRAGEQPHPTRPDETVVVWRLVAQERQPRDGTARAAARPLERDPPPPAPTRRGLRRPPRVLRPLGAASAARVPGRGRSG